jgi:tetratricopeptide (TPR) repeat protein
MALRLTGPTAAPDAAAPGLQTPASPTAATLGVQALTMLAAGDLDGYRRLLGEAAQIDEPQRRYQARVGLLEHGLLGARQASTGQAITTFAAVAGAAMEMLESEAAEPIVLNYAGIACYELWALEAAQLLFRAAHRLDPGLANTERNLQQVAARKRMTRPRRPLHTIVPTLARRARAVSDRARPAAGLTLSLCMIVRDEEQMLGRCLAAAAPAVDEIVIVDTGSSDGTVQIARSFGATVIEHPWTGSFADARNASFAAATGDWLLYLDADEVLVAGDAPRLKALTGHTWREAISLVETSFLGELGDGSAVTHNALRMFRNRPAYRFTGSIHEQIAPALPTYALGRIGHAAVRIEHYGYLGTVRDAKEKFTRNIELLRQQAAESGADAFLHFNLGCEYAASGDAASAVAEYEQAWSMLSEVGTVATCEYAPALISGLVKTLRASGQGPAALERAETGLKLYPDFTDLVLEQATTWRALGDLEQAEALYRRCLKLGDAPARYGPMVGTGTFLPRLALARLLIARGEIAPARELLEWCLEHHPDFFGVAAPYTTVRLANGDDPADVVAELEERLLTVTPAVRHALAVALQGAGAIAAAERQYRLCLADAPNVTSVRVALAELLLRRGDYADAAQHAAMVAEADPFASLACRLELCGLIAGQDTQRARAAMARAARVGLPAVERDVFEAWTEIAEGGPARTGLPAAGMALLGTILELLLAAGDTAGFDRLAPALQHSELAVREQRELLAGMYLAHGHEALAAQHWMMICHEAPDSRALVGLARLAAARGLAEDAANFAAGALELDPECTAARGLLDRLPVAAGADE